MINVIGNPQANKMSPFVTRELPFVPANQLIALNSGKFINQRTSGSEWHRTFGIKTLTTFHLSDTHGFHQPTVIFV